MNTGYLRWIYYGCLSIAVAVCSSFGYAATPEERAEALLQQMTLKEKVEQLMQIDAHRLTGNDMWDKGPLREEWMQRVIVDYAVGSILIGGSGASDDPSIEGWLTMLNTFQRLTKETRLQIPLLFGLDAVHGHGLLIGATLYPHNLGLASTWNRELATKIGQLTAEDLHATGIPWNFGPVLDVSRDPRWGRTYETLGEDPYLVAELGKSKIEGFQASGKVLACAKHFTGYSNATNGHDRTPADFSERTLREIHLPPYKAAIEAGVETVMVNSGEINGVPVHASSWLLTDILRGELGFQGFVVTDFYDIVNLHTKHNIAATVDEAIVRAYNAGIDMNMAPFDLGMVDSLVASIKQEKVPLDHIDDAIRKILTAKFKLGLFENRYTDAEAAVEVIGREESKRVALEAATQSIILLKNRRNILPLSKDINSLIVAGSMAKRVNILCGGWTVGWQGAREEELPQATSILEAIKREVSPKTQLTFIREDNEINKKANAAVVVVGEEPYAETPGDVEALDLSTSQKALIQKLAEENIPIILVVVSGRPLTIAREDRLSRAVLWIFVPGTEGGNAIADVLFGDANPSGHLPITIPKSIGQLPMPYNARRTAKYDPLYAFGQGLSYTRFTYSNLNVPKTVALGESVRVQVTVKNAGKLTGDEVVMVFVKDLYTSVVQPEKKLVGFRRVSLAPGEEQAVSFTITPEQLSLYDERLNVVQEPGEFEIDIEGKTATFTVE